MPRPATQQSRHPTPPPPGGPSSAASTRDVRRRRRCPGRRRPPASSKRYPSGQAWRRTARVAATDDARCRHVIWTGQIVIEVRVLRAGNMPLRVRLRAPLRPGEIGAAVEDHAARIIEMRGELAGSNEGFSTWRAFSARLRLSLQSPPFTLGAVTHGNRSLLGQRQSLLLAGAARARVQAARLYQPPAAVFQAGAQVAADAGDELPRPRAGAARTATTSCSSRSRCSTTSTSSIRIRRSSAAHPRRPASSCA